MKIAIIGRSDLLLNSAKLILKNGHKLGLVITARSEDYYEAKEGDFERLAKENNEDFILTQNLNSEDLVKRLSNLDAEIAISVNWPNLIGEEFCSLFPLGILNAHAGDLPRYRGNACPNWAIINQERRIGLSIHQMDPFGIDTGDIFLKKFYELKPDTYIGEIYDWLREIIPNSFLETLDGLEENSLKPSKQSTNEEKSLRCYPRRPSDGLINWNLKSSEIYALIRATSEPFSGAFSFLEGENKVYIWRAENLEDLAPFSAIPGQILFKKDNKIVVACGQGAIKLINVSFEEKNLSEEYLLKSVRKRFSHYGH